MSAGKATGWLAGGAEVDITPGRSQFLFGYPHVRRFSSGVHDPLLASALYLAQGEQAVLFVACDVIFIPRPMVDRVRVRIARLIGITPDRIMITATHTHSGPVTTQMVSNAADPNVPPPDAGYLGHLEEAIVRAGVQAYRAAAPAKLSHGVADGSGLGGNRRDPSGPSIPDVPVLLARRESDDTIVGVMCVVSMHPTVLHEDWTLVSGDFPGLARQWLRQHTLDRGCPFVYHMGASGNQSPRHVVKANTIEEAARLGEVLGRAVAGAIESATPVEPAMAVTGSQIELPLRSFPPVEDAEERLAATRARLEALRAGGGERATTRTAECDVFGAEETVTLARAARSGAVAEAARECMPAEVQVVRIGDVCFVGWPGEVFVEYALRVREQYPAAHIITLANGDLQGYVVTQEAIDEGAYEAGNAIFASPASGEAMVETTLRLLGHVAGRPAHGRAACPTP